MCELKREHGMEKLFSTKKRIKILENVIYNERPLSVNAIAANLGISKGLVSKYLNVLAKGGIAKKSNSKYVIVTCAATRGIRAFLNIENINVGIFKKYDFVTAVGLYGSCVKGENTEDSDVDIWIKIKNVSNDKIAPLTNELNKKIKNIKLIFLTNEKLEKVKKEDELFYHSLVFGSIILYGGKNDIQL